MNRDTHIADDPYLEQLADWEARLEKGEALDESSISSTNEQLQKKLGKGLAALKLLDGVRKRLSDTPASAHTKPSDIAFTQVKYKLPCRFGKFELLSELGRGGFGVVFLAKDRVLDCQAALKMPHAHVLTNDHLRERFLREARVAAGLQHPHIVPVHEAGVVGPVNYIVYSYCQGITLGEWLRIQKDQIPAQQAAEWIASLAEAVAYAHGRGVMHRDIKPSNILLHDQSSMGSTIVAGKALPNKFIPRITDFGLAKLESEKQNTATGAILGTPAYMAPEQASGKGVIGPSVDIHALGVLLYELLSGYPPYRGESDYDTLQLVIKQEPLSLRKIRPKLSRDLETICHKCLQKDPELRYKSAAELAADLRHYLNHEPIKARPVSVFERSWRQCRRHPVVTGLVVALLLALVGGVTGIVWQYHQRGIQSDATQSLLNKHLDLLRKNVQSADDLRKDARTAKEGRERLIASLPYFDALLQDTQTEPTIQLEVARLAYQAASIHQALGEYSKAISRYQQAVDLLEQYQKVKGTSPSLILEQANMLAGMAFNYRNLRKWDHSEVTYRQAINNVTRMLQHHPENHEAVAFICNTLIFNCGNLYKQNRVDEAELDMLHAITQIEKALKLKPNDSKLLECQAFCLDDYGWHWYNHKRQQKDYLAEAEKYVRRGLAIRKAAFEANPSSRYIREVLARSYWRMASLCAQDKKRVAEAAENLKVSMEINDKLSVEFPGNPGIAHNTAWDRLILCDLYERNPELDMKQDKSEKLLKEAIDIRMKCMQEYPTLEVNIMEVSTLHFRLASLLRKKNQLQEAESHYQFGLKFSEELAQEQPANTANQEKYASHLQTLAAYYESDRILDKAEDAYRRLMKTREQMVERFPTVIAYKRDLESSYVRMAGVHRKLQQWKEAADLMSRSVHMLKLICVETNDAWRDRHALANRHVTWGKDLRELGQEKLAVEKMKISREIFEKIEKEGIQADALTSDYAHCLSESAVTVWESDKSLALEYFKKVLPLREALYYKSKTAGHRNLLARCHFHLNHAYWYANYDLPAAIKHYVLSCALDPSYCGPPISPKMLIRVMWIYLRPTPKTAEASSKR